MRIRFEDDDLRRLYMDPEFRLAGMGPDLIKQYRKKVAFLVNADNEQDLVAYRALRFESYWGSALVSTRFVSTISGASSFGWKLTEMGGC